MMTQEDGLRQIENLGDKGAEFLVAAGVEDLVSLARSDASALHQEMEGANAILAIDERVPAIPEIEEWIKSAVAIVGVVGPVKGSVTNEPGRGVALEKGRDERQVQSLQAIPVPPSVLIEQQIVVQDVAAMELFLDDEVLDYGSVKSEMREDEDRAVKDGPGGQSRAVPSMQIREPKNNRPSMVEPLDRNPIRDIRKTASPGLNKGKKLHSRGYIRGVLHPQPYRVRFAALITVITLTLFPATFVAGGLMLAKHSPLFAIIPAAFLLCGILYLMYARGLRCRICGQPLVSPKACHRHSKAHRIPLLGYILPTCFHILFFHWFRCMYCGTSIRIKE